MKIRQHEICTKTAVGQLSPGTVFTRDGKVYMRITTTNIGENCVGLACGGIFMMGINTEVYPHPDSELTVK